MEPKRRHIEFMFIDRDACQRCAGTGAHLTEAIAQAREILAEQGIATSLDTVHVTDADMAVAYRLVSSPTVRVDGRDIAGALVESRCAADGCTCGDGEAIDCRLWEWQGTRYEVPPVALLVERIVDPQGPHVDDLPYQLPQNLARYFSPGTPATGCCTPANEATCCAADEKDRCCGDEMTTCGCT